VQGGLLASLQANHPTAPAEFPAVLSLGASDQAHTRARTWAYTHTHARARARAHAHKHTHTHTHTISLSHTHTLTHEHAHKTHTHTHTHMQLNADVSDPQLRSAQLGPNQVAVAGGAVLFGLIFVLVSGADFAPSRCVGGSGAQPQMAHAARMGGAAARPCVYAGAGNQWLLGAAHSACMALSAQDSNAPAPQSLLDLLGALRSPPLPPQQHVHQHVRTTQSPTLTHTHTNTRACLQHAHARSRFKGVRPAQDAPDSVEQGLLRGAISQLEQDLAADPTDIQVRWALAFCRDCVCVE